METKITEENKEFIDHMMGKFIEDYFELIKGFSILDGVSILGALIKLIFDRIGGPGKEELIEKFIHTLKQELSGSEA